MASLEQVTVDKAYFDALLRRADFHTSAQLQGRPDPANVSISRVEYESLLRTSREFDLLKNALFQGGITAETLDLLISGARGEQREDSCIDSNNSSAQNVHGISKIGMPAPTYLPNTTPNHSLTWRTGGPFNSINVGNASNAYHNGNTQTQQHATLRVPPIQRQVSYGMYFAPEDAAFDDDGSFDDGRALNTDFVSVPNGNERRTLFFSGLSERATYRDIVSLVKGGKLLSVNLRNERSATVTFYEGAAEFLAWSKRNDIYLHSKRIEVKWADHQYHLNSHIANKIANGATRNVTIHSALERGLTEARIRDDMEHIHNLMIIDITFRKGSAYVSMNSVHNALFARTCMMSRSGYKGCKIEFFRDECDTPLPNRAYVPKAITPPPMVKKKASAIANRFDMLNLDDASSDEENRTPSGNDSEDDTMNTSLNVGVSLNFLDDGSV